MAFAPAEPQPWEKMKIGDLITITGDVSNRVFMHARIKKQKFLTKVVAGKTHIRRIE